ncbi:MAG: hypothetical protein HBSAPP03_07510 [Phycisphaerae bacterium]|nr:MAG: hypothetical protein HBSAPP03_07510 [Phycisphaerae bacterium]
MSQVQPPPRKFAWPPRPIAPEPSPRAEPKRERSRAAGSSLDFDPGPPSRGWWHTVEAAWLGLARPPLVVRAAQAGWAPDPPEAYCPRCGGDAGSFEVDDLGCMACRDQDVPWSRAIRLGAYEGVLRDMILDVKYTAWRALGVDLGRLLGAVAAATLEQAGVPLAKVVLVPVPSTFWRRMARGVNHASAIAQGAGEVLGAPVVSVLTRRHRPTQVSVAPSKRAANVRNTMRRTSIDLAGRTVVLVDDVRTTGATLAEACRALRYGSTESRPASILAATLAVTPTPSPR